MINGTFLCEMLKCSACPISRSCTSRLIKMPQLHGRPVWQVGSQSAATLSQTCSKVIGPQPTATKTEIHSKGWTRSETFRCHRLVKLAVCAAADLSWLLRQRAVYLVWNSGRSVGATSSFLLMSESVILLTFDLMHTVFSHTETYRVIAIPSSGQWRPRGNESCQQGGAESHTKVF